MPPLLFVTIFYHILPKFASTFLAKFGNIFTNPHFNSILTTKKHKKPEANLRVFVCYDAFLSFWFVVFGKLCSL